MENLKGFFVCFEEIGGLSGKLRFLLELDFICSVFSVSKVIFLFYLFYQNHGRGFRSELSKRLDQNSQHWIQQKAWSGFKSFDSEGLIRIHNSGFSRRLDPDSQHWIQQKAWSGCTTLDSAEGLIRIQNTGFSRRLDPDSSTGYSAEGWIRIQNTVFSQRLDPDTKHWIQPKAGSGFKTMDSAEGLIRIQNTGFSRRLDPDSKHWIQPKPWSGFKTLDSAEGLIWIQNTGLSRSLDLDSDLETLDSDRHLESSILLGLSWNRRKYFHNKIRRKNWRCHQSCMSTLLQ
jgi:hypothetical protein